MTMDSINEILDAIIRGSLLGFLAGFWLMGLAAKRFTVSNLLEIIETASNSLVAVAVKSVEVDGSSAVNTGIYFGSLKKRLTVCIHDARCRSAVRIDEICICICRIIRSL